MASAGEGLAVIGRSHEMEVAARLLRDALGGRLRLLLLSGPPGVGKSTVARELTAHAEELGARCLWGAGQEDLSIPYLPMTMVLDGLRDHGHPDPPKLDDDPAVSWTPAAELLVDASERQPLVVVLDDLQWTDPATQSLLLHILAVLDQASRTRPVRCLLVVVIRTPVEDERTTRTVARLQREPGVQVLDLQGLDRVGVTDLVTALGPSRPTAVLVDRVYEATGGNPLLVRGLVRRGLAEGRFVDADGALHLRDPSDPLSIDATAVDRGLLTRIERVSEGARRLLTIAAFLGDEQPIDDLLAIAGVDPDDAEPLLDEAVDAGLLVERGTRCASPHPQVRHLLFHRPNQRTRQRLHLELADALERLHGDTAALRIAHHLVRAGERADGARRARWCGLAADQARAQGAWADATIAGEYALDAMDPSVPWQERADLHSLVLDMASFDFDLATAVRHGTAAIALAQTHGDEERWGRTLLRLARTLVTNSTEGHGPADPARMLEDFLVANADAPRSLSAQILALLAEIWSAANRPDDALEAVMEAHALLEPTADSAVAGPVLVAEGLVRWARLDLVEAADAYRRTIEVSGADPGARYGTYAKVRINLVHHLMGEVELANRGSAAALEELEPAQVWGEHALAAAIAVNAAVAQARFDDAEHLRELMEQSVRRSQYLEPRWVAQPAVALARAVRGDGRGAYEAIEVGLGRTGTAARYRLAVDALLGDTDRVREALASHPWREPPHEASLVYLPRVALHAELGTAIDDADMAAAAVPALVAAHERGVVVSYGWSTLVARAIGDCKATMGLTDDADAWLTLAAREATAHGLRLEAARVALSHARLLARSEHDDRDRRVAFSTRAITLLDGIGALPLMAAARRVEHGAADATGPVRRVILFTDLVGSTTLNVRLGDQAFLRLVQEHNEVVRGCLRRRSGVEFKHTGDGVAAWFTSAVDAVECAGEINDELDRATLLHPDHPLLVRCGISSGEPLGNEGDLFGITVVHAARLCSAAAVGEVLVSPEVAESARSHGIAFHLRSALELKGFPEPVDAFAVVARDRRATPR